MNRIIALTLFLSSMAAIVRGAMLLNATGASDGWTYAIAGSMGFWAALAIAAQ